MANAESDNYWVTDTKDMREAWDFPVTIKDLTTKATREDVPARAIIRDDTGECLAVVSKKYHFISHDEIFDPAIKLVEDICGILGKKPKRQVYMSKNGAIATMKFEFKDHVRELHQVGDRVGFRVFVTNSYTGSGATVLRIGGLVLSCTNGMVRFDKDMGTMRALHVEGSMAKLNIPSAESVINGFDNSVEVWNQYGSKTLSSGSVADTYLPQLLSRGLVTKTVAQDLVTQRHENAWDLMQSVTHHLTHQRSRMSEVARVEALHKANSWFESTFL